MLSSKTWECVVENHNRGFGFKFFTFNVVPQKSFYKIIFAANPNLVKLVTVLCLSFHSIAITFGLVVYFCYSLNVAVAFLYLGFFSLSFLLVGAQVWHLSQISELPSLAFKFMEFQKYLCKLALNLHNGIKHTFCFPHLGKFHEVSLKAPKVDGYERHLQVINWIIRYASILLFPAVTGFFFFTDNDIVRAPFQATAEFFCWLGITGQPQHFAIYIFLFFVITLECLAFINGFYCIALFVNFSVLYTNSTRLWMSKMR